jgi:hypothetical protein
MPSAIGTDPERHALVADREDETVSEKMTMWPATMLAKRRTVRAKGSEQAGRISTGTAIGHSQRDAAG